MSFKNNKPYRNNTNNNNMNEKIIDVQTQLDIYSKKRTYESALKADLILKQIVRQERKDLKALCESEVDEDEVVAIAQETEEKLKATTDLFFKVLQCWSKCRHASAPVKAEEVLSNMFRRHMSLVQQPNNSRYYTQDNDVTSPTVTCFAAVMNAWANSRTDRSAQRCEEILRWMEMMHKEADEDDDRLKPNTFVFNILIKAWSHSRHIDAAYRAEDILKRMGKLHQSGNKDVIPDVISFHTTIKTWSHSNIQGSALKAQRILNLMEHLPGTGCFQHVKPNKRTYLIVIQAWLRTSSHDPALPFRIEHLLKRMHRLHTNATKNNIKGVDLNPNAAFYNFALSSWSKSKLPEAALNANVLFQSMERECDTRPNTKSYTLILKTWAKSNHESSPQEVYNILNQLLSQAIDNNITNDSHHKSSNNEKRTSLVVAQPNLQHFHLVLSTILYTSHCTTTKQKRNLIRIAFQTYRLLLQQQNLEPNTMTFTKLLQICLKHLTTTDPEYQYKIISSLLLHTLHSPQKNNIDHEELLSIVKNKLHMDVDYNQLCKEFYAERKELQQQKQQENIISDGKEYTIFNNQLRYYVSKNTE